MAYSIKHNNSVGGKSSFINLRTGDIYSGMKNCARYRFKTANAATEHFVSVRRRASRHRNVSSLEILFLTRDRERRDACY